MKLISAFLLTYLLFFASSSLYPQSNSGKINQPITLEYLENVQNINSLDGLHLSDSFSLLYETQNNICKSLRSTILKARFLNSLGQYDKSLQLCLNALNNFSSACDSNRYIKIHHLLSTVYLNLKEYKTADSICQKALSNYNVSWALADTKCKLFINAGIANSYLGKIEEAFYYFKKAMEIAEQNNLSEIQELSYSSLGTLYAMTGQMDSAAYFIQKTIPLAMANRHFQMLGELYNNLAGLLEDKTMALTYMDSAIYYANKFKDLNHVINYYGNKALALKRLNRFEEGYEALYNVSLWKDSLFAKEKVLAFTEFQESFKAEKKARQIQELQLDKLNLEIQQVKEHKRTKILQLSILFVLILSIGLYSRLDFIRRSRKILQIEKDRSEELLLNILPSDVAEELKTKGYADAKEFEKATILFTDFKGFTSISEKMTASSLVNEINSCFKVFDGIMEKYKIEKIKTIGDAYMAAGGMQDLSMNSVKNTVLAALEMQEFITSRKLEREALGEQAFQMRVGIHTGPVVAGIVGVKKFQYDIWGDTVNTASRMESNGEAGKVNISQTSYELLKDLPASNAGKPDFKFESRGKIEAKGKGEMEMWFVNKY
ncbi:MAG: hypothetical protein HN921_17525 [Bacteroidetes bacterium]|jgi:class 3 adenylate cyclase|nr:hypothetical protein [Bacteroidota bacterium]MBT5527615.1 hypothetical protein [Cytophagia bacterium]MBT3423566.1 hypothetical protein [Bacteroidota bacterium]MBT3934252.1 hypothetical protein [Bacteroidota bacterium]MBT4728704.1 hypothetical protein [Bacteroidota bacterium]